MSMSTLRKTKTYVVGLETLFNSHFPGDEIDEYAEPVAREAKLHHVDRPQPTGTQESRLMECIHWDTAGPMRTRSI